MFLFGGARGGGAGEIFPGAMVARAEGMPPF